MTSNLRAINTFNLIFNLKKSVLQEIEKETSISRPESIVEAIFTQPYTKVKAKNIWFIWK